MSRTRIYFDLTSPEFVGSFDAEQQDGRDVWEIVVRDFAKAEFLEATIETESRDVWTIVQLGLAAAISDRSVDAEPAPDLSPSPDTREKETQR